MTHLGRILVRQGRFEEARPLLERALGIREATKPPGHWKTAKTRSVLGACYAGLGRIDERTFELVEEAYAVIRDDRGAGHRRTIEALERLIAVYEAAGRSGDAAPWGALLEAAVRERRLRIEREDVVRPPTVDPLLQ